MSNEIVIQDRPVALMARESTKEIQEIGRKLMKLTPGGKKLDPEQCAELAVASFITGANPFANEIYYMPTVGPYLGYQFYNRKANEQLAAEDPRTPPRIWFDEKPADHTDAQFSDDDIAWTVTLHDSVTHATWLGQQMEMFIKLTTAGLPAEQAWKIAESKAGPEPIWKASAVVYSDEEFSKEKWEKDKNGVAHPTGEMKPEKWDRNERCKKRAQKWALRKRFSNMVIPDPELGDDIIDAGTREIIDQVTSEIKRDEQNKPVRTVEQNLLELGFNSDPIPPEHDSNPPIEQNGNGNGNAPTMDIKTAMAVMTSEKEPRSYGSLTDEDLNGRLIGLRKKLVDTKLDPKDREEYQYKLSAAVTILNERAKGKKG